MPTRILSSIPALGHINIIHPHSHFTIEPDQIRQSAAMKKSTKSHNKNNLTENASRTTKWPKIYSQAETVLTPFSAELLIPSLVLSSSHQSTHQMQPQQHNPTSKTNESSKQSVNKLQVYFSPSSKISKEVSRIHKSLKKQSMQACKGTKSNNIKKGSQIPSKFQLLHIDNLSMSKSKEISESYYCQNQKAKQQPKKQDKLKYRDKDCSPEIQFHKKPNNNQPKKTNNKNSQSRNKNKSQAQPHPSAETQSDQFIKAMASTNSKIIKSTNENGHKSKASISRNNSQPCESIDGKFGSMKRLLGSSLLSEHKYQSSQLSYTMRGLTPRTKLGPGHENRYTDKHQNLEKELSKQSERNVAYHKEQRLISRLACVLSSYKQLVEKYEKQKQDLLKEQRRLKQKMKARLKEKAKNKQIEAIELYGELQTTAKL